LGSKVLSAPKIFSPRVMLRLVGAASLLCGVVTGSLSHGSTRLQPEVVAKLLSQVEAEWVSDAQKVIENQGDSGEYENMRKSCSKVSSAVVSSSDGEKDRVTEYMSDVCAAMPNKDSICAAFSNRLTSFMSPDASMNRDGSVNLKRFCKVLYKDVMGFAKEKEKAVEAERAAQAKLAAERKAEEAKRREEESQKQAEALEVQKLKSRQERDEAEAEKKAAEQAEQEKKAAAEQVAAHPKLLPKVWEQQPDRFMDRLQAKTQAAVKAQVRMEQKLQAAYFAKQKAKTQAKQQPEHLLPAFPKSVSSMGL